MMMMTMTMMLLLMMMLLMMMMATIMMMMMMMRMMLVMVMAMVMMLMMMMVSCLPGSQDLPEMVSVSRRQGGAPFTLRECGTMMKVAKTVVRMRSTPPHW